VIATRLAAREALQEANNQLERKITERTTHLRASNERLKGQIRERRQAEDTLRRAQDELVQAGKLAAIGQMSTSIAHELNQPLAALRTLSGNTVRFLERGDLKVAAKPQAPSTTWWTAWAVSPPTCAHLPGAATTMVMPA
jgi:two-component system, sensor histidine kinase AauS